MRGQMWETLQNHAKASIGPHKAKITLYLSNPAGIDEHSDILEVIQTELDKMSVHAGRLEHLDYVEDSR